jgi:hypothetical protein
MRALVGRGMMIFGMFILPVGLYYGFSTGNVRHEVGFLAVGAAFFLVGRAIAKE